MAQDRLKPPMPRGDLQDGMLAYYLWQAKASDVNVEARLDREPFDFKDHMLIKKSYVKQRIEESSAGKAIGQQRG